MITSVGAMWIRRLGCTLGAGAEDRGACVVALVSSVCVDGGMGGRAFAGGAEEAGTAAASVGSERPAGPQGRGATGRVFRIGVLP